MFKEYEYIYNKLLQPAQGNNQFQIGFASTVKSICSFEAQNIATKTVKITTKKGNYHNNIVITVCKNFQIVDDCKKTRSCL